MLREIFIWNYSNSFKEIKSWINIFGIQEMCQKKISKFAFSYCPDLNSGLLSFQHVLVLACKPSTYTSIRCHSLNLSRWRKRCSGSRISWMKSPGCRTSWLPCDLTPCGRRRRSNSSAPCREPRGPSWNGQNVHHLTTLLHRRCDVVSFYLDNKLVHEFTTVSHKLLQV